MNPDPDLLLVLSRLALSARYYEICIARRELAELGAHPEVLLVLDGELERRVVLRGAGTVFSQAPQAVKVLTRVRARRT